MPNDPRKRLRYFDGQFLKQEDFIDEQAYHLDRQRRHNRLLHTPGIADGLDVKVGASQVVVDPGTAVDGQGRQIILTNDDQRTVSLSSFANQTVLIVISYQNPEIQSDPAKAGKPENTRWLEQGILQAIALDANNVPVPVGGNTFPPDLYIRLALLKLGANGAVTDTNLTVRVSAGVKLGGETVLSKITLSRSGVDSSQFPTLSSGAARQIDVQGNLAVSGTINGRNSATDGTTLDTHVANRNNPHGITPTQIGAIANINRLTPTNGSLTLAATDVGAVPTAGGTVNGLLNIRGNANPRLYVESTTPGLTGGTLGAAFIFNGAGVGSCGLVAKITSTPTADPNPPSGAALVGIANFDNVFGVYARAKTGTHALFVEGTANVTGRLSSGHVVDTFINASEQRLKTGDVVKLKGTPIHRFRGQNNSIPVAEVVLADQENDTRVIGIVDSEAIPDPDAPDIRVEPDDPTFIEVGRELYIVTLGAFAHCKVDATEIPIAVGDLLTSSQNPGHAKKATDPKLGSIIGKALEPLPSGTGYIAVFVNIQ